MSKKLLIDEDTLTIVLDALEFAGSVLAECRADVEKYGQIVDRLTAEMKDAEAWKNIKDEFPSEIGKLYIVRATRDGFTIFYLCKLVDLGGWVELTGYSPYGRRFSVHEPKSQPQMLDLPETEQPLVMWRMLDA